MSPNADAVVIWCGTQSHSMAVTAAANAQEPALTATQNPRRHPTGTTAMTGIARKSRSVKLAPPATTSNETKPNDGSMKRAWKKTFLCSGT